jgi:hypothetical protein
MTNRESLRAFSQPLRMYRTEKTHKRRRARLDVAHKGRAGLSTSSKNECSTNRRTCLTLAARTKEGQLDRQKRANTRSKTNWEDVGTADTSDRDGILARADYV